MMTKTEILNMLSENDLEITFTKKDGTERVLKCTNNIPEDKKPKTINHQYSQDVVDVFDTEKHDWRSFRLDSVKEIKVLDTHYGLLQE